MDQQKRRWTPEISAAVRDVSRAAAKAAQEHDLSSNEMLVVLASVASHWVPVAALPPK